MYLMRSNRSFLSSAICDKLINKVPRKFKRLVFLSSILGIIDDIKNPTDEIISKLNEILSLAHDKKALMLPIYIHSFIWKGVMEPAMEKDQQLVDSIRNVVGGVIDEDSKNYLIDFFITHSPEWLRYGSIDLIKKELNTLFTYSREIVAA